MLLYRVFLFLHEAKMVVSSAKTIDFELKTVMSLGPIRAEPHK